MNILLLGSGGREHAIAWKLAQSPKLKKLFIAPGNPGTALCGTNVNLAATDFSAVGNFCLENKINILVVGPEEPLVNGIHDYFIANEKLNNISVIGPVKAGAMLEGSKAFSKKFMEKYSIPTARYKSFSENDLNASYEFLDTLLPPYVLKADGLAAGKGVLILDSKEEAKKEIAEMLSGKSFGKAGTTVVIEEFLTGIEVSVFVLTDGKSYKILPEAKDYKRIGENDTGPNTGGMGAVSPVHFADNVFMQKVETQIIIPTIEGLKKENISYKGFIFFGIIKVGENPLVIEYNCRMGDPETEAVMPRIKSDLVELFEAVATETLSEKNIEFESNCAATVVLVSGGYPDQYEKEKIISGLDKTSDCLVFHAGTKQESNKVITTGGRVIAVTGLGNSAEEALKFAFANAEKINYEKKYFRKDIGQDLLKIGKSRIT